MVRVHHCENPEELEALLRTRTFRGSKLRTNVAKGEETEVHSSGRVMLKEPVMSDVVKSGKLFNAVKKQLPWCEQLTLNRNLCCTKHTDRNEGNSYIAFFGTFDHQLGGGLQVYEEAGTQLLRGKGVWFEYNGRDPHETEPWSCGGDRYSIVAYRKPPKKVSAASAPRTAASFSGPEPDPTEREAQGQ